MLKNWLYLEKLIFPLLDKKGRIIKSRVNLNPDIISELKKEFPDFITISEISYAIKNKLTSAPFCSCGKSRKWDDIQKQYFLNCSKNCINYHKNRINKIKNSNLKKYGVENVSQVLEIKEKIKNNYLNKYGVASNLSLEETKEKIKKTNLEKYGFTNPQKNSKVRNKTIKTNIKKYGVEYTSQLKEFKEKRKETCIFKYGVDNPNKSKIVRNKIESTNLKRYGVINPIKNDKIKEKIKETNLERYGAEHHMKNSEIVKNLKESFRLNFILKILPIKFKLLKENNIHPLWDVNDYQNSKNKDYYIHGDCGLKFLSNLENGKLPKCPKCHKLNGVSTIEKKLQNDLSNIFDNIKFNDRKIISPLELDIIINDSIAIEVNGTYWHNEDKNNTPLLEKSKLCPISLLHFWDSELENKYDICLSMILSKLNKYNKIIYARKCKIKDVSVIDAREFLNQNHLQGYINSKYRFGLYYNDELVFIMTVGKSRFNKNADWEIHRISSKLNTKVIGGASKLFSYLKKQISGSIITYADKRYSEGDIYKTLGFTEKKDSEPNYFWTKDYQILKRYQTQKHKLKDLLKKFDPELSEFENMRANNYHKIKDCGNKVFMLNI